MYASGENTSGNVPAFLMKVWTLVEDPSTDELIFWDRSGTSFHVFDQQRFSREILPMYFKHNNIASFIRQLNMYGFRKVAHIDQGGLKIENDDLHFQHPYFQKGEKELLQHIKRKVSSQTVRADALTAVKNDEVSRVLTDVNQIKSKQQDTEQNLDYIKRENKLLWKEIAALRQKHHKQQEIVNKLIQFLVSLVSSNRTGLTIPPLRRAPLAIDSAVATQPMGSASNASMTGESLLSGISNNYSIESPKSGEVLTITSPNISGPIIHELSETSPNFLHSPHTIKLESSPYREEEVDPTASTIISSQSPILIINEQPINLSNSTPSAAATVLASPLPSPKIEQVPSLEDALHFDWMSQDAASSSSVFVSPTDPPPLPTTSASSQGKTISQKRKRTKPSSGLSLPDSTSAKKANNLAASSPRNESLMTPDIVSTDQASSTLDQLVMNNSNNAAKGDATLALSASNAGDDISISSNQLDFLSSDLDGLRGLLQDQYKLDPSILYDLFESANPWPIVSDKNPEDELERNEEPSTSDESGNKHIIGTEVVTYNPKELFPDLLEDGIIGDIDDID